MTVAARGAREKAPEVPTGRIALQPPPEITPSEGASGLLMQAVPMLGSLGSIGFVALSQNGARAWFTAGMFLVASVGFVAVSGVRQRQQHGAGVIAARREYLAYLAEVRETIRDAAARQREAALWDYPDPGALPVIAAEGSRVWERQPSDVDFLQVRMGTTAQPLCLELEAPETAPLAQLDPVAASGLHRLLSTHRVQPGLPASVALRAWPHVEVTGDADPARSLARSVVLQAAMQHGPEDLVVAALVSREARAEWEWLKWLPHALSPREHDAVGPVRLVGESVHDLLPLLPQEIVERPRFGPTDRPSLPHVLLVVDGGHVPPGNPVVTADGVLGVTVLDLPEQWGELDSPTTLRLAVGARTEGGPRAGTAPLEIISLARGVAHGVADQVSTTRAEAAARRLAPRFAADEPEVRDALTASTELVDLLGTGDVRDFDTESAWRARLQRDRLRVPIGVDEKGLPVALDIKESAQQGMGPHGLVIGATGSGKSELLRTLVLALAMTHSPEALNFVLVDFKGGATFAGMADMPHVSAVITNLGQELTLVERMQDALQGEMTRRQELLRSAGNFANVTDYERARAGGADLEPLPALLIVADEFSELLAAKPEFADLFVAIGRLGRSLSMHLLLSSQRLEEGRLRGLESHLSYRIGLRTFSAGESRTVIGVPDAYELPPVPGLGYLKPDQTTLTKFKAAYVSGPPKGRRRRAAAESGAPSTSTEILPFTLAPVTGGRRGSVEPVEVAATEAPEERAVFDIAVSRMKGKGRPAHQVWLPPLDVPHSMDQLFRDLVADPELGLVSRSWRDRGDYVLPVGIVDRPLEQRRELYVLRLGGAAGHVAVVGGPRSGRSTFARTVVAAIALTTTPLESQVYVLDFGGGTFTPLAKLAHVAGVANRSEPEVVRRLVAEIRGIVDARESYFRTQGIDSIETYRRRRAEGRADDGYGDVFLVVDGWPTVRAEFDELEAQITELAGRGLTFGVHLVVTTSRWMDFRNQIRDVLGTRVELRLGDPTDSEVDRKVAANVPKGRPGRGLTMTKHHFLGAVPRIDDRGSVDDLGDGVEDLVTRVNAAWQGPRGPKLRLLPEQITLDEVRALAGPDDRRLLLGVDEANLAPIGLDLTEEPHLYLLGDGDSGKTAFLRTVAHEVARLHTPEQAKLFVVDYRRGLLGELPEAHVGEYLTTEEQTVAAVEGIADFLRSRLPGPDVTPEQLRARSWWSGAEVYFLVDDYDLVVTSSGSPLRPLVPMLAQAGDVGLHLVLTRRTGGASRALFEPVLQSVRDLGSPGILLSGSADEGMLIGRVKASVQPPGRARIVSRDLGDQVFQTAWQPPRHD
ncbi:type VII secretion protein EccCa [Phycicoccus sonneratiae]|uniref:Type VII secretion protein EccCa n=1 Tax=Phycicoccus sonneratiae TaxID=2807628 RepID=A0ABS2CGP8_9MICO|nr:type VII secretion protein EccCa [Phycicoccus sonneraticus]MBM6399046.1 type VII secretion protein EccCa [Phycicoccus sonneraticus]